MISDDDLHRAIARIAGTPDGQLLRLKLLREARSLSSSLDGGALQATEGKRRFALELIALMDKGAQPGSATSERTEPDAGDSIRPADAKPYTGRRGLERRVEPYADDPKPA